MNKAPTYNAYIAARLHDFYQRSPDLPMHEALAIAHEYAEVAVRIGRCQPRLDIAA